LNPGPTSGQSPHVSPVREQQLEGRSQFGTRTAREAVDARRHPRFKLEVDIRVYPRDRAVVRGHTVDLSESGISAMLREELGLDEVVRLEFNLPHGEVEIHALVRQRNAFRYGFQFLDASEAHDVIGRTCRELALKQTDTELNH
jgi:c-di-GMP-binding flagellar brake protein YcgR